MNGSTGTSSPRASDHALPISLGAGILAFVVANAVEADATRWARARPRQLEAISDVVLSLAFIVATYLWLHLRTTRARLSQLERNQIALETQLVLAADIQRNLLPVIPGSSAGCLWAARLEPAGKIGGDFYDFLQRDPHSVLLILGDISGKGIPAALLTASTRTLFRALARTWTDPAEIARRLSHDLYQDNAGASYLTCVVAHLDGQARRLTYVNAGHPAGLLVRAAGTRMLDRGGPPAGLFPDTSYDAEVLALRAGDIGILVSDGVTEALEGDGASMTTLVGTILARTARASPQRLCEGLMQASRAASGPIGVEGWQDDRTVLAFVVHEGAPPGAS